MPARPSLALLALMAALAGFGGSAEAKIGPITFDSLVRSSDRIVVGHVDAVTTMPSGALLATITVEDTWKGRRLPTLTLNAAATWTCDVSDAIVGERAVLFLWRERSSAPFRLMHSGRGRMPIRIVDGVECCTMRRADVGLPESVATLPGPDPKSDSMRDVEVAALKRAVETNLAEWTKERRRKFSLVASVAILGGGAMAFRIRQLMRAAT